MFNFILSKKKLFITSLIQILIIISVIIIITIIGQVEALADIIFSSNCDGNWEIYGMNYDGTGQINLTNNSAFDTDPAFSPSGEKVIFSSDRDCSGISIPKLYTMDNDGTNVTLLPVGFSVAPDGSLFCEPDILRTAKFSPDGSKIVFRSSLVPGGPPTNEEIYLMNADGTNLINLSNNPANDRDPVFTPDGNEIVFVSDRDGDREIYIMDNDGSNQTSLTFSPGDDDVPEISPDGSKIIFTSERDGNYEVYCMDIDGENPVNLSNNLSADGDGYFSPDGSKIAFISDRDGNLEIYIMDSDGTNQTRLTNTQGSELQPFFNPLWTPPDEDTTPPTIEIISPSDGETVSGTVRFSSYATDDHGLEKVEFYIDDELKASHGPFGLDTVASTCNWDCDTTTGSIDYIPNGNHTFKAKAFDTAGQTNVDTISFVVDNVVENQPPSVQITSGPSGTIDYNDVTFTWSGNDPDGEVTGYYYGLDNPTPDTWTTETNHTFNSVSEGNHTFYVQAKDNMGATSSVISRSFTYTPPVSTSDISLEEVEISKYIQLMSSYNPNNVSVKVKYKNIGEVAIDSFQIELYINEELKHTEREDNKIIAPGTSGFSFFFWTLSEDICGDNIKMEIKITDVNPVESNSNTENNSKTKNLAIYYVPFNIKEETYSFANPEFTDWLELKSSLDETQSLMIAGLIYTPLGKLFKSKGYCYGMASTVIAYKEDPFTIPYGGSVNDLEFTMPEVRKNILDYQNNLSALGIQARIMKDRIMYNFPAIPAEYQKIIDFIGKENLIMLNLGESGKWRGGHQLVAYQCITDKEIGTAFIYVYDSNCPESEKILELPLNTGIFGYEGYDMLWAEDLKPLPQDLIEEYFNDLANLICNGLRSAGQELINVFSSVNPFKNKNGFTEDTLITDEYGRKIGYLNGVPVNEIPDGVIEIFGDFQTYQIPLSLNYNIQIKGKEQGVFELHLTKPNPDDTMLNLVYEDVPTENNSEASLTIGPSVTDFTMQLDQDGDGVVDEIKEPDFIEGVILLIGDFGSANNGSPDCKVDFEDLMIFALAYGSTPSDANWNPVCDIAGLGGSLTPDGVIDFEDLMIFAMHYGDTCADL